MDVTTTHDMSGSRKAARKIIAPSHENVACLSTTPETLDLSIPTTNYTQIRATGLFKDFTLTVTGNIRTNVLSRRQCLGTRENNEIIRLVH